MTYKFVMARSTWRVLLLVFCTGRSGRADRTRSPCPICWSDNRGNTCTCRITVWTRRPDSGGKSAGTRLDRAGRTWRCWSTCSSPRRYDSSADCRWCRRWLSSGCRRTSCGCSMWSGNSPPFSHDFSPSPALKNYCNIANIRRFCYRKHLNVLYIIL